MMVPFNSALKTTLKNHVLKYEGQKHRAFVPDPTVTFSSQYFILLHIFIHWDF